MNYLKQTNQVYKDKFSFRLGFYGLISFLLLFLIPVFELQGKHKIPNAVFFSKSKLEKDEGASLISSLGLGRSLRLHQLDDPLILSLDTLPIILETLNDDLSKNGFEIYYRIYIDTSLANKIMAVSFSPSPFTRIWWDGKLIVKEGAYDTLAKKYERDKWATGNTPFYSGKAGWHNFAIRQIGTYNVGDAGNTYNNTNFYYSLTFHPSYSMLYKRQEETRESLTNTFISEGYRFYLLGIFIVSLLFYFLVQRTRAFLWFCIFSFSVLLLSFSFMIFMRLPINPVFIIFPIWELLALFSAISLLCFLFTHYTNKIPKRTYLYFGIPSLYILFKFYALFTSRSFSILTSDLYVILFLALLLILFIEVTFLFIRGIVKKVQGVNVIGMGIFQFIIIMPLCALLFNGETIIKGELRYFLSVVSTYYLPTSFLISLILVIKKNFEENLGRQQKVIDLTRAQEKMLAEQNVLLEQQVSERTHELREEKLKVEEKNTEILDSINYAQRIQRAILPSHANVRKHFPEMFLLYMPKDIVAGDFYWMQDGGTTHPGWVFFAVCDCTGHGVPGALLSVVCSKALNKAIEFCKEPDPGKILDVVTGLVSREFSENSIESDEIYDGMDVSFCAFHPGRMELRWAGANNPLWLVKSNGEMLTLNEVKPDKQAIGINDDIRPFMSHTFHVQPGDCLYLFSDGYADQFGGPKRKKFSSLAMRELIMQHCNQPMQIQQEKMVQAHEHWKGNLLQVDDICVWGIRF